MDTIETIEMDGITIKIYPDDRAFNPRTEYDNLGKMVCFHKRYDLGDKHDYKFHEYSSWEGIKQILIKEENALVILPIYMYDHSGLTVKTTPFSCQWDSGQIGYIYITAEQIRKEMCRPIPRKGNINPDLKSIKHITRKDLERAEQYLIGEVKTYDQYLRGDVYGYVVEDRDGNDLDSCWGFYGLDYCIEEAKSVAEYHKKDILEQVLSIC
jgi:hypothetical protein